MCGLIIEIHGEVSEVINPFLPPGLDKRDHEADGVIDLSGR